MKNGLYLLLGFFFLASCSIHRLTKKGVYKELEPTAFLNYVNDSSINLIDVRTAGEFEKSHISGAININYIGGDFKNLDSFPLDKNKPILIYCETQHRSLFVAKILYKNGFRSILDLDKGMMHWRKINMPFIEKDSLSIPKTEQ